MALRTYRQWVQRCTSLYPWESGQLTRILWILIGMTVFLEAAAAQEAPSPTVEPPPTSAPPEPSAPPPPSSPPEPSTPPEPEPPAQGTPDPNTPPSAPDEGVGPPAPEDPTAAPDVGATPETEEKSPADPVPAAEPDPRTETLDEDETPRADHSVEDSEPAALLACVVDSGESTVILDCFSTDGEHHRFEVATGSERAGQPAASVSDASIGGPAEFGFVKAPAVWPFLAIVGVAGVVTGAWTTASVRPKASTIAAARSFLAAVARPENAKRPLETNETQFEALIDRTLQNPEDANAHLELAVQLFDRGQAEIALRTFERAIHLRPEVIVAFLDEPRFAPHRDRDDVRAVLRNVWRDRERRFAGYV